MARSALGGNAAFYDTLAHVACSASAAVVVVDIDGGDLPPSVERHDVGDGGHLEAVVVHAADEVGVLQGGERRVYGGEGHQRHAQFVGDVGDDVCDD